MLGKVRDLAGLEKRLASLRRVECRRFDAAIEAQQALRSRRFTARGSHPLRHCGA